MCPTDRRGLTLIELLIALSMMAMLSAVLGGLAMAVQSSSEYTQGHGAATQHARVALERITRAAASATAVGRYPGFAVAHDDVGTWRFPETLVVWRPESAPANPAGPPLVGELVIFCPDPQNPEQLLEITAPGDARTFELDQLNEPAWRALLDELKTSEFSQKVILTDLLRLASTDTLSTSTTANLRAAVRFSTEMRPSESDWSAYPGTLAWNDLPWPQGIRGSQTALRQVCLRVELQLVPGSRSANAVRDVLPAIPFFGSTALYYEMHQ